jgi:hypothetical protein
MLPFTRHLQQLTALSIPPNESKGISDKTNLFVNLSQEIFIQFNIDAQNINFRENHP